MSFYRQTWRVTLEGSDPIEVTTTARDSVDLVIPVDADGRPQFAMGVVLHIVHNALVRTETPGVPRHFTKFLGALIGADEVAETAGEDGKLDPIQPAVSAG